MMHPPVSPGSSNVLVNGGKAAAAGAGPERASIDAIPHQSKNSSRPAETVGNCIDDKSHGAGKMQNKDTGVQKPETPNGRQPPRATPTHISDIRLPSNKANGGTSTGGFVPLQLTSPTEATDYEGRLASNEIDMAAKSPTEPPAPVIIKGDHKKADPKNGTKVKTPPTTPPKNEKQQTQTPTNMPSTISPAPAVPNGTSSGPPNPNSGAPYIEDSDSEDEELQELLTQKRDQIRRDIAHYQRSKEMELLVYEKRLRDDHMRRKRRKHAQANGNSVATGSPRTYYSLSTKSNIGTLPGYLPLTPTLGGTAPARPSGLRNMVENRTDEVSEKPEGTEKVSRDVVVPTDRLDKLEASAETIPEIVMKSPPNTKATSKPHKGSPAISPITPSPNHHSIPPQAPTGAKLSASALKALEANEKAPSTLPSSLKSTSSWTSGSGKDSRRSSVNDNKPKKNKHVVFQLEIEGDFFRFHPDGEEIPMDPQERERLRTEALSADLDDYDSDSESDYLEFKVPSSKATQKPQEQDTGYNSVEVLKEAINAVGKPNKGPEDPDWISTKPAVEPKVHRSAKSTVSDDSIDDDVFDLDEELPYDPPTATAEFASGSLEDSVMSLGLPLAPPPPPPPSGSGLALPPSFGLGRAGGTFADTLAYIQAYQQAGISRGSSVSGSYLSSSFPRNSFGSSSWREPNAPAPPRPSSSHGSSSGPSAPVSIGRRASGGVDLVTAPTLEMLSSSISGSVGQTSTTLSGSLPIGSGFRRRSVTKYDIPDEDVKDSSASSSVTSKSDILAEVDAKPKPVIPSQISMPTPTRKSMSGRTTSEEARKASPYGTSAPITIPPRSASVPPIVTETVVAPEQAKDDVPKEVVSGRPSPQSSSTTEKSNQAPTAKARTEAQKKPVLPPTSVEKVLEATTEALSKSTLPSSGGGKPKREHKSGSRSGSSTPKIGSYSKKSPSSRSKKAEVKPEPWHGTIVQSFPTDIGNKSLTHDAAQAVSSPGWNSYSSASLLSSSLPKYASGASTSTFATNPITALPGIKSYSPTSPALASNSPRKGPITLAPGPRYASAVAEEAAATVEANGLSSASVVGRPDLRMDAKAANRNSLVFTETGPESLKEILLSKEPGSLSLSARLALEEAGQSTGPLAKK
ncbi:hypothetical protein TWF192_001182 [Orbilia oligospora]|uniref:Uncharacterized protein n=1 Tax=Orbilia oligospora TaxID=2813651 RepID=A0A6G1LUE0_ORBOL|nr:hypothetical protein TWF191_009948 [Orbilia oligospora]KAF3234802.1 hypothetical protein TWF192_001182 [Orbilia oligospora]